MRLKRENFIIMWAHWKIHFLGKKEVTIKLIYSEELPKKRGLHGIQIYRRGALQKRAMHFM